MSVNDGDQILYLTISAKKYWFSKNTCHLILSWKWQKCLTVRTFLHLLPFIYCQICILYILIPLLVPKVILLHIAEYLVTFCHSMLSRIWIKGKSPDQRQPQCQSSRYHTCIGDYLCRIIIVWNPIHNMYYCFSTAHHDLYDMTFDAVVVLVWTFIFYRKSAQHAVHCTALHCAWLDFLVYGHDRRSDTLLIRVHLMVLT